MKKSILGLKGAQELTKDEQRSINGKGISCADIITPTGSVPRCPIGYCCRRTGCFPNSSVQCGGISIGIEQKV